MSAVLTVGRVLFGKRAQTWRSAESGEEPVLIRSPCFACFLVDLLKAPKLSSSFLQLLLLRINDSLLPDPENVDEAAMVNAVGANLHSPRSAALNPPDPFLNYSGTLC